ncbi:YgfZ/GcvT domain-containing protein [Rosistilla oblonga]|uniref:CAF17-like 4Fe-4S cluster assembly/insertion protein YgfZ n=1 Tax=Rosistilla oblonga TaxID=2527990 RepID=UPI003A97D695
MTTEYEAFTAGRACVRIDDLCVVEMTGDDRTTVLNNLTTNDFKRLEVDHGWETFITDVRGRAIGHVCGFNESQRLLMLGCGSQGKTLASHIDRYIIREDAVITDRSEAFVGWLISGQQAPAIEGFTPAEAPRLACGTLAIGDASASWFQLPWTSGQDCLVLASADAAEAVEKWLTEQEFPVVDGQVLEAARIAAGWPRFGIDCSDANLPQEVDRNEQTISFTKGCYLGQETIARLDALGQVQKKLVQMQISGDAVPATGTKLIDAEKPCGEIRSAIVSPTDGKVIAIGYVRRKWFDAGSQLQVADSDQTATVL